MHENDGGHGDHCACCILAQTVGCARKTISYRYCLAVLQRRWTVDCDHGCHGPRRPTGTPGKWHDLGDMDAVKAILITNE